MKKIPHLLTQLLFLTIFIALILNNKAQLWFGLFLFGVVVSLFMGRIFCGWVCPINTAMSGVDWIKKKLHLKSFDIPKLIITPWTRYIALGLFIVAFIFSMASGSKVPLFPLLFVLGIVVTSFFPEKLWHYYLCPFGTVLSCSASKASHTMRIDADTCNNCGACKRICPAHAIEKTETHKIVNKDCLVCMECPLPCKQNSIRYQ